MPTVSCSVRRAYPFYTERNFKKLLIDVLVKAGTHINACTEFVARTGFNPRLDVINVQNWEEKKLNNLIFSCLSHKIIITAGIPTMSSMFPTFTRKFGWFTLTLPGSLTTKFLLTKGGVGSFGFSHFFKASFSVFARFGSRVFLSLAVRGFPFLAPGSRFLASWNTRRFSDLVSDVVFGFSKFIGFQFLRPLQKKWTCRSLKSFGATHMKETVKRALHTSHTYYHTR